MFGRMQDAASVGIWVVVVAVIAGLLVLLLQSRACAAQPLSAQSRFRASFDVASAPRPKTVSVG